MADETNGNGAPAQTSIEALEQLDHDLALTHAALDRLVADLKERAQRQDVIAEDVEKVARGIGELMADVKRIRELADAEALEDGDDDDDDDEGDDEPADDPAPAAPRRSSSSSRRRR